MANVIANIGIDLQRASYTNTAYEVLRVDIKSDVSFHFPPRPAVIVDREYEMAKLLRYLHPDAAPRTFIIQGMGGVGKTTLALEAAYRAWEQGYFSEFIFMTARRSYWDFQQGDEIYSARKGRYQFKSFNGMIERISSIMNLSLPRGGVDKKLEALRDNLTKHSLLLLIDNLDAVDDPEVEKIEEFVNFFLPQGNKVIITSRTSLSPLEDVGTVNVYLSSFDETVSYSLVKVLSQTWNVDITLGDVSQVIAASQGNPLVIQQIMALATNRPFGKTMRDLDKIKSEKILPYLFETGVSSLSGEAWQVLVVIAVATFPVTKEFIGESTKLSNEQIDDALDELKHWSFVSGQENRYDVHYLLESFLIDKLRQDASVWKHWKKVVQETESYLS